MRGTDEHVTAWGSNIETYQRQLKEIIAEAHSAGVEAKDTLDYVAFLKPVEIHSPRVMKLLVDAYAAEKVDPDHYWEKTLKRSYVHSFLVVLQVVAIFAAFALLLGFSKPQPPKPAAPDTKQQTPRATP